MIIITNSNGIKVGIPIVDIQYVCVWEGYSTYPSVHARIQLRDGVQPDYHLTEETVEEIQSKILAAKHGTTYDDTEVSLKKALKLAVLALKEIDKANGGS